MVFLTGATGYMGAASPSTWRRSAPQSSPHGWRRSGISFTSAWPIRSRVPEIGKGNQDGFAALGFLPNGLKRRLGAVSGKVNGCTYCTSHDCSILKNAPGSGSEGWSMTHEELTQLLRGDDARERNGARLLRFRARRVAESRRRAG